MFKLFKSSAIKSNINPTSKVINLFDTMLIKCFTSLTNIIPYFRVKLKTIYAHIYILLYPINNKVYIIIIKVKK